MMLQAETSGMDHKYPRMHQLALTMYRNGDIGAAFKIWQRLKEQCPDFPEIDKWLQRVSNPVVRANGPENRTQQPVGPAGSSESRTDPSESRTDPSESRTDPSVFRMQRDLMGWYGASPRKHTFRPRSSGLPMIRRFRDRNVVYTFLILSVLVLFLSVRNNRSYMLRLNPDTHGVDCYQGNFFPLGWQKTAEIDVGIHPDWHMRFKDRHLIRTLQSGIRVRSLTALDGLVIDLYMTLGDEMLQQMTVLSQQSAIFYYKRIENARYRDRVAAKIAHAFANLARMYLHDGDYNEARRCLASAQSYDPANPDVLALVQEISRNAPPGFPGRFDR
ncbi:tetratricopeptide repeat protein [bacterium]|nr:tetratricopeptide repeat protein [candidate division CSSED10-310 bacterium]